MAPWNAGRAAPAIEGLPEPPDERAGHDPVEAEEPVEAESSGTSGDGEDLMADDRCPRCRCSKVRVSRPRNRFERLLRAIGLPVRRCHRCYFRYIDLFRACLEMPTRKHNR